MKVVRRAMIGIGVFYLLNLVLLWPALWAPQLPGMYPGVMLYPGEPVFDLLLEAWLIVGIQLAAVGLALLWGARVPERYAPGLFPTVIIVEVVDLIWDLYSASRYEAVGVATVTVTIHVIVIAISVMMLRRLNAT